MSNGNNTKLYLIGGGILVAGGLIYLILRQVKGFLPDFTFKGLRDQLEAQQKGMAKVLAVKLQQAMIGISGYKDFALVREIFNRLKTKNDIKLVVKSFGLPQGQNLFDWVDNETNMTSADKHYITTKIMKGIS